MSMSLLTPTEERTEVACLHCGPKPLKQFRPFRTTPPVKFYDVCESCVVEHGLLALYEQHAPDVDPEILDYLRRDGPKLVAQEQRKADKEREAIQRDLIDRALAQRHIVPYVKRFMPTYHTGWVHHDICSRLERFVRDIEDGKSPRLILALPPRAGKSILGSDFLPSWALGKHPEWEVIAASHSIPLSLKFSRNIRDRLRDPKFVAVFPECRIRDDNGGVEEWRTTVGGGYRAAGVGTGILGMGAHLLIIDDPFPDAEAAYSVNNREKVRDWFNTTAMSRLAPNGGALIIAQRWHDDDLTGYVLRLKKELIDDGATPDEIDDWEIVNYPAIAEGDEYLMPSGAIAVDPSETTGARLLRHKGEALHPERYDLRKLNRIKHRMPPAQWNALYQQNPVPDEGDFFSKDMFRFETALSGTRDEFVFLTAWDVAIGEKRRNDYSVGVVVAVDSRNSMHVVDMVRGRFGTNELVTNACDLIQKWDCLQFGMEHGQIKMTLWPLILEEMRKRKITCSLSDDLKPITDKEVRAQPLRGLMQTGRVVFPVIAQNPWVETMQQEMLRFPTGVHDDIVDALAWAAQLFRKAPRPQKYYVESKPREAPWRERLDEFGIEGYSSNGSFMAN
jgi:predicted phage terminase large subunit-like protein